MSENSKIEWTDSTWTPIRARAAPLDNTKDTVGWYCEHVSEGCRNCYAEGINKRLGTGLEFKPGHREYIEIFLDEKMLLAPLRWKKPRMIFVCSMTDLFGDWVKDEWIDKILAVMALCPQHTFQVLTKRAGRMQESAKRIGTSINYLECHARSMGHSLQWNVPSDLPVPFAGKTMGLIRWPLPNVWLGISAERQQEADERIPHLLQTPAAVRFVSLEPLLGPIDLRNLVIPRRYGTGLLDAFTLDFKTHHQEVIAGPPSGHGPLDWVIVGGESGPKARPMHPQWARDLRDQCQAAGVPFFFKQHGQFVPESCAARDHQGAHTSQTFGKSCIKQDSEIFWSVGKRAAGRLLDGREHNDMPGRSSP